MSFKVMITPEDPTYNGYILKPFVEKIMTELGKPNANVVVLNNPSVKGFEDAKRKLESVFEKYPNYDLFLFLPDRDGVAERDESLLNLTKQYQDKRIPFIAKAAVEEIEVWLLAGHKSKLNKSWSDVRKDASIKESVFQPFLEEYGDDSPGEGRERLMKETLKNFRGLKALCPEIEDLVNEIDQLLKDVEEKI